jgi:hypothetical protein
MYDMCTSARLLGFVTDIWVQRVVLQGMPRAKLCSREKAATLTNQAHKHAASDTNDACTDHATSRMVTPDGQCVQTQSTRTTATPRDCPWCTRVPVTEPNRSPAARTTTNHQLPNKQPASTCQPETVHGTPPPNDTSTKQQSPTTPCPSWYSSHDHNTMRGADDAPHCITTTNQSPVRVMGSRWCHQHNSLPQRKLPAGSACCS